MIGEIRMFAGNFAPKSWAFCQGQILSIASNTALFSILGTTYGGNGTTTFALPNLSGRVPVGAGQGPGLQFWQLGQAQGSDSNTLTSANLAAHSHPATGTVHVSPNNGTSNNPQGNTLANGIGRNSTTGSSVQVNAYANTADGDMGANSAVITIGNTGSNIPVNNIAPVTGMNYIICQFGIFPSRG